MKSPLRANEQVLKEGPANLKRNVEAVGGKLYLTNQRLVFESHAFNVQTGVTECELGEIESAEPCWTTLLFIPIVPNGLTVTTRSGERYRMVVFGRRGWADAINAQRQAF